MWVWPRNKSDEALQMTVIDVSDAESRPSRMWLAGEEVDPKEHMPLILINPEMQFGEELEIGTEGCLSFPEITGGNSAPGKGQSHCPGSARESN